MAVDDPFKEPRKKSGVLSCAFQGERIPMILRHADVRAAAKDWQTYSSDAPFRVPIPSEEKLRTMRQLPIETNPPEHTAYRAIVEPFFQRAKKPEVIAQVESLIEGLLKDAMARESVEIVRDFALPLQSRALSYLLNVSEDEAETWISWGIHVFHEGEASALEDYLHARFDLAKQKPGDDFFSALTRAEYDGRPLTYDEMMGFANLTFAGGRDTVIHTVSSVLAYFSENPTALDFLREDPKRIVHASEEFFRIVTPLTHIGRVCPVDSTVQNVPVKAKGRVSLCWASANQDETVFDTPEEVRLDRKPNPHIAFGFGAHLCLGAAHARLIVRTLLQILVDRVSEVEMLESRRNVEHAAAYTRPVGYELLRMRISARQ